jgi:acyl-CoA synthetase (AMP-forming)/AMP-acid ligase II
MPHDPSSPLGRAMTSIADSTGRYAHIASTILRAGVVPLPTRLGAGLAELVPLIRYGTTLGGLYAMAAASAPERVAVVDDHKAVSFAQLDDQVAALAHALAESHGIGEGAAVGILARNHVGFVQTILACSRLGADAVLLNTGMSAGQAGTVAREQQLAAIVVDADLLDLLSEAPDDIPLIGCGAAVDEGGRLSTTTEALRSGTTGRRRRAPAEEGRTVVMTSGTTGAPKGARRPGSGGPDAAAAILSRIPLRAEEVVHIAPPLFHTWGLANLQLAAMLRSTVVLRRAFDPAEALRVLSVHRCSTFAVVPVMLQRILDLAPEDRPTGLDLSALRIVAASGSALPSTLAERWQGAHGRTLYNLYGSTEVSWATIATPDELAAHPDTAGRAPRGTRLAILDDADQPVPAGEIGRIFVGNDLQFEGYTGDAPEKSVVDGLMAVGDVGRLDSDGLLYVAGRDDDMIVSGGENVFPKEVEDLLSAREDVVEAAVIGVDDDDFGQRLVAFVVLRNGDAGPSPDDLRDHVRDHLARFSVPREVVVVEELPRNPTGKVLARELEALLD